LGIMGGAILSHIAILGIAVKNSDGTSDGGLLFIYALIVFICCLFLVLVHRKSIPILNKLIK
jgi:putative oxidoreductase